MEGSQSPNLFKPGLIGNVTIKNRIVMAPMGTTFWGSNGEATDRTIDHYEARAKGGAGLITVSFAGINYPPVYEVLLAILDDNFLRLASQYRLVETLHDHGAKVSLQLMHMGRQGKTVAQEQRVSSSDVACVWLGQKPYPVPRALEKKEIYQIIEHYASAALNAKRVGYDMVEVHGAHGYLVNSFISPYLNRRTDEFGGSLENRMRFPVEIIKKIKEVTGENFPVGIRISGDEFIEGGITTAESPIMAQILEEAGADFIHVSGGIYETLHKSNDIMRLPEGWKSYIWEAVKKAVRIPTFAAGGNRTPEFCEEVVAEGRGDFVTLGRQLLADPEWPNKVAQGKVNEIRKCISCMECLGIIEDRALDTRCTVNVAVGREKQFAVISKAAIKKKVIVVGGGPAGMEAARVASLRGHQVKLYDRNDRLGGLLLLGAAPPGKQKLLWIKDYYEVQLERLGVEVKLGVEITLDFLVARQSNGEPVIVATGSEPIIPKIPGLNPKKVVTAWDILRGRIRPKVQKVVVCGGGIVGAETAELLAEWGNTVTIVEMLSEIAADMEQLNRKGLIDGLAEKKVKAFTKHEVIEISPKGLLVLNRENGEKGFLNADQVIIAMGSRPLKALADDLNKAGFLVYTAGDCRQPRNIMAAVYEGAVAASHRMGVPK